ncbi:FAD:protein FMN transferase [Planctomycetota bacterium]
MTQNPQNIEIINTTPDSIPGLQRFSHEAMATTFEIIIQYEDKHYARQAAFAAFEELDRLEQQLSRFIENSDISQINKLASGIPLMIDLDTFECLQLCSQMYVETSGAFDITIGSLYDCWLDDGNKLHEPTESDLDSARQCAGLELLKLDEAEHSVQLVKSGVQIDLGGFGKGYALDRLAELLRQWSIDKALLKAASSSVLAIEGPAGMNGWPVTLSNPSNCNQLFARLDFKNRALGGSGLQKGRHIIDPRTACPVGDKTAAWACAVSAATADALSTAFMVMSIDEIEQYCRQHQDVLAAIVTSQDIAKAAKNRFLYFGPWKPSHLERRGSSGFD